MKRKIGRPTKRPEDSKGEVLQVRVDAAEKQGFAEAAKLNGLGISGWARERLRAAARRELSDFGRPVPFATNERPCENPRKVLNG
jgi:hypothetical protein